MPKLPTYFISHGGGPWPYMDDMRRMLHGLDISLQAMPGEIGERPAAVLMVSGHWEEAAYTAMAHPKPPMLYDYYGFPEHTYHIQYPALGSPALAERVRGLIESAGLPAALDAQRGYDHGTFVPMAVMYPEADMPLIQLSLRRNLDAAEHIALGRALAPLREEGVLIVGSGLSYHNLRLMGPGGRQPSLAFDGWLDQALVHATPAERVQALIDWQQAPSARVAHPREDHLIPLMVAVGAAEQGVARRVYHDAMFGGVVASSYRFDG